MFELHLNCHIKKFYILRVNMAIKSLEKTNLRKKTEGILLLDTTNWYWGQKLFCHFIWSFTGWYKMSHIYIGRTKSSPLCQNLENCRRNISAHRRLKKLRFFLFERTWTCEWFKILTNLKILNIFGHIVSSLGRYVFGSEISYNKAPPRLPGLGC